MKLNTEQRRHVASVLHTFAAGQLAAFGYVALRDHSWWLAGVSGVLFVALELLAVRVLAYPEENRHV